MIRIVYGRFLRWAFARFYREFAWTYDVVAATVSRGLWRHWIVATVPWLQGDTVLELGSGTGYLQQALQSTGKRTVGLDPSPYMLRLARRKVVRSGGCPTLVRGYAQQLPFRDASFSDVVATFPSEYILDPATLAEAWRVLTLQGQFVLINTAHLTQRDAYAAAVDVAYRATHQVGSDPGPDLLRAAGFDVTATWVGVKNSRVHLVRGIKPAQ